MARSCLRLTMSVRPRRKCWSRARNGAWCGRDWIMTPYSKPTIFRTGWKTDRVSRAIGLARGALFVERGLPAAAWALGLIGLFIALALFQAYAFLPWTLHAF